MSQNNYFEMEQDAIVKYIGSGANVTVPKGIKHIKAHAFEGCETIESITLPDTLRTIEDAAFFGCKKLIEIDIPDGVKRIGESAFAYCTELTTVTFPATVTFVGKDVFLGCESLQTVYFLGTNEAWRNLNVGIPPRKKRYKILNGALKETTISAEIFHPVAEEFSQYLLLIEGSTYHSYDNSDDDRASDWESRGSYTAYGKIDLKNDYESYIWSENRPIGVVFRARDGRDTDLFIFYFDKRNQTTMRLGYSASHSSNYLYIESVTLVKKGVKGAPAEGENINFSPNAEYPSL